jgi:hypothetical protein
MSCRMIYQEYRPDYDKESSHERFHIWLPYMTELVAQRERCNQPLFRSNPTYIRAAAYRVKEHIPTKPELKIDITPLLRACQRQPELRLKFDIPKVDTLFDRTNEKWWKYFDEKVAEVSVFPRGLENTEVHVVVKASEGEDWMERAGWAHHCAKGKLWLRNIGFVHFSSEWSRWNWFRVYVEEEGLGTSCLESKVQGLKI